MSAPEGFEGFVQQERERLEKQRQTLLDKKTDIDQQLQEIERQFAAIRAYEQVRAGKHVTAEEPKPSRRGRRSGRRQEVLGLIKDSEAGQTRGEIIEKLRIKGDRREEQSVSNALSALKRAGQITQDGARYIAA